MRTGARATAAVLAAAAVIAAVTVVPGLSGAQTNDAREITVRMKVRGGAQVQHGRGASGDDLAPGDAVFTRLAMFSPNGAVLGSAYSECVNVGAKADALKATLQCAQTYRFKGGQIVTVGVVRFTQLKNLSVAILGGSGAYRGASGFVTAGKPVKGFDSVDILHLDG